MMAIITDIEHIRGIVLKQYYVKVSAVTAFDKQSMQITASAYPNKEASQLEAPHYSFELVGDLDIYSPHNLWEQAYIPIKNKWPEYLDA